MKQENKFLTAVLVTAILAMTIFFSSCATSGWGCHGRGKIMTRVKP